MKNAKKKVRITVKRSKKMAPHIQILKQYAELKGVPVEDVIDEVLGWGLEEAVGKTGVSEADGPHFSKGVRALFLPLATKGGTQ